MALQEPRRLNVDATQSAQPGQKVNIPALTGLRFLAAIMILVHHAAPKITTMKWLLAVCIGLGGPAMPIFFTLSGFVMWLNYADSFHKNTFTSALRTFASARFARLYPLYIIILFIGCFTLNWETFRDSLPAIALWIPLLQTWAPGFGSATTALVIPSVGHLWSISVETTLYALFPFVALSLMKIKSWNKLLIISVSTILFLSMTLYYAHKNNLVLGSYMAPGMTAPNFYLWLTYCSPVIHIFEFLIGCIAGRMFKTREKEDDVLSSIIHAVFVILSFLAILTGVIYREAVAYNLMSSSWFFTNPFFLTASSAALIGYIVYRVSLGSLSLLSYAPIVAGGEISYSIYMLHPLILVWLGGRLGYSAPSSSIVVSIALIALVAMITIVASCGTYFVIERPGRRFLRNLLSRRTGASLAFCSCLAVVFVGAITYHFVYTQEYPHHESRLKDLKSVVSALEAFKRDHGHYPTTLNPGGAQDWVGIGWNGTGRNWLPALVPQYMAKAPRDPRDSDVRYAQYLLKSDAEGYKLLSLNPEDCNYTILQAPELSDPVRNQGSACLAYGYWTGPAVSW